MESKSAILDRFSRVTVLKFPNCETMYGPSSYVLLYDVQCVVVVVVVVVGTGPDALFDTHGTK